MKAQYMDHMGTDLTVVNAARVSFESESWFIEEDYAPNVDSRHYAAWSEYTIRNATRDDLISVADFGLIQFLAEHNHWTPFGHPQIQLRMKAPVPIRTQCFKHKQGFVENEESRRYISSTPELFVPEFFREKPENAKQGSGGEHPNSWFWEETYKSQCEMAIYRYEQMIFDGVCPEQARLILPQGTQVNWVWTGSLAAFARFYKQRTDSHAQVEIQQLAREVGDIVSALYPVSWEALTR